MEEVCRHFRNKYLRDNLRNKITLLENLLENLPVNHEPSVPHKFLRHHYRHVPQKLYNEKEQISNRKLYPFHKVFMYEPLARH